MLCAWGSILYKNPVSWKPHRTFIFPGHILYEFGTFNFHLQYYLFYSFFIRFFLLLSIPALNSFYFFFDISLFLCVILFFLSFWLLFSGELVINWCKTESTPKTKPKPKANQATWETQYLIQISMEKWFNCLELSFIVHWPSSDLHCACSFPGSITIVYCSMSSWPIFAWFLILENAFSTPFSCFLFPFSSLFRNALRVCFPSIR